MARKTSGDGRIRAWQELANALGEHTPQLNSVVGDADGFISLYVKLKDDGTIMGVLKRYGPDGGPLVCFGSGYGLSGCFIALDSSIAGNKWRVDKPWDPSKVK